MEIYGLIKRNAVNDPTGLPLKDKDGNVIGKIIEYDKETGEVIFEIDGFEKTLQETIGQFDETPQKLTPLRKLSSVDVSTPAVEHKKADEYEIPSGEWGMGIAESLIDEDKVHVYDISDNKHKNLPHDDEKPARPAKPAQKPAETENKKFKKKRRHRNRHKKFKNNGATGNGTAVNPPSTQNSAQPQPINNVQTQNPSPV